MTLIARSDQVEDVIRAELIRLNGLTPGLDVTARNIRRVVMEKFAVCTDDPSGAVEALERLANPTHRPRSEEAALLQAEVVQIAQATLDALGGQYPGNKWINAPGGGAVEH